MKTLKISESLHSQLRISAAKKSSSIQSLAEGFITTGLAELLKRKAPKLARKSSIPKIYKEGSRKYEF